VLRHTYITLLPSLASGVLEVFCPLHCVITETEKGLSDPVKVVLWRQEDLLEDWKDRVHFFDSLKRFLLLFAAIQLGYRLSYVDDSSLVIVLWQLDLLIDNLNRHFGRKLLRLEKPVSGSTDSQGRGSEATKRK